MYNRVSSNINCNTRSMPQAMRKGQQDIPRRRANKTPNRHYHLTTSEKRCAANATELIQSMGGWGGGGWRELLGAARSSIGEMQF